MSQSYGERVRKDTELIEEVPNVPSMSTHEVPEKVVMVDGRGNRILRCNSTEPGVHERKVHKPGTCLEPGRD